MVCMTVFISNFENASVGNYMYIGVGCLVL